MKAANLSGKNSASIAKQLTICIQWSAWTYSSGWDSYLRSGVSEFSFHWGVMNPMKASQIFLSTYMLQWRRKMLGDRGRWAIGAGRVPVRSVINFLTYFSVKNYALVASRYIKGHALSIGFRLELVM